MIGGAGLAVSALVLIRSADCGCALAAALALARACADCCWRGAGARSHTPPDLLIARDGTTVAIAGADGRLHLLAHSRGQILRDRMAEARRRRPRLGSDAIGAPHDCARCDALGCIAQPDGLHDCRVVRAPEALSEDCAQRRYRGQRACRCARNAPARSW